MTGFDLLIQPDETEPGAAEVLVDGAIGDRPYRFLLDTGAGKTSVIIDDYLLSFISVEKHHSSGVFAKSSDDLITVPSIALGPILRTEFTVTRTANNRPDQHNLIGMDLLKDYRCHFLFDENRVLVDADDDAAMADDAFQPLVVDEKYHPYVEVQFDTADTANVVRGMAVWDTGASITIVDMTFVKDHSALFQEVGHSAGTDSTGVTVETPMFTMAATVIGGVKFPSLRVAGVDLSYVNSTLDIPMNLILGYSTISRANWLFDFPGKRWAITKRLAD